MRFKKVENCDLLLEEDPKIIQEQLIDYIIYNREELRIGSNSINYSQRKRHLPSQNI